MSQKNKNEIPELTKEVKQWIEETFTIHYGYTAVTQLKFKGNKLIEGDYEYEPNQEPPYIYCNKCWEILDCTLADDPLELIIEHITHNHWDEVTDFDNTIELLLYFYENY